MNGRHASRRRRTAVVLTLVLAGLCYGAATTAAAPPDRPAYREIRVPAEDLDVWLSRGEWQALGREQFQKLLDRAAPVAERASTAWISRAVYEATLDGEVLDAGRFTWQVRRSPAAARGWLPLEPLSLALESMGWIAPVFPWSWHREEAAWGADRDGRGLVVVDRTDGLLQGRWNLRGRRVGRNVEFQFDVAPAAVSELRLRLPPGLSVSASPGEVVAPASRSRLPGETGPAYDVVPILGPARQAGPTDENGAWRVLLGSESRCRLVIGPAVDAASLRPLLLTDADTLCLARREGFHVQTRLRLEVLRAPVRTFSLTLPSEVQVFSVRYGGELPLGWKSSPNGRTQRLTIDLPDPLMGSSRSISIDGLAPAVLDEPWTLPRPTVENAVFQSGRVRLSLESPLELRDYQVEGCRVREALSVHSGGETIAFEQWQRDGRTIVALGAPPADLEARVINVVECDPESWWLRAEIEWRARTGRAFSARFQLPPGWEVTRVRPANGGSAFSHQQAADATDGGRVVSVEFQQAVSASDPRRIQVSAVRPAPQGESPELPVVRPLDVSDLDSVLALGRADGARPLQVRSPVLEAVEAHDLPQFVLASELWQTTAVPLAREAAEWLLFRSQTLAPEGRLIFAESGAAAGTVRPTEERSRPEPAPPEPEAPLAAAPGEPPPCATVELRSLLAAGPGFDVHQATLRIQSPAGPPLRFGLPPEVELISVEVGGMSVAVGREGDGEGFLLPRLPADRENVVEIRYRAPSLTRFLRGTHTIPVPTSPLTILRFDWEFALPPHWELLDAPWGTTLDRSPPALSWTKRLFGPLGRPADEPVFNPLDARAWQRLALADDSIVPDSIVPDASSVRDNGAAFPAGWTVWRADALDLPAPLTVALWSPAHARGLAWVALLGCLTLGLLLRSRPARGRQRLAVLAASGCLLIALAASADLALVAGGALLGTLLASALPRGWVRRERTAPAPAPPDHPGSTRTAERLAVGATAIVIAAALAGWSWPARAAANVAGFAAMGAITADERLADAVLVPSGRDLQPLDDLPVVYVARPLLERLEALASKRSTDPAYLIATAEYRGRVDEQASVALEAAFRVAVLSRERPLRIDLPLSGAFPAGTSACRVNGAPHPLLPADDGRELQLAWTAAAKESALVEFLDVAIDLQAALVEPDAGHSLVLTSPPAGATRVVLEFREPPSRVDFPQAAGRVELMAEGRTARAEFGRVRRLAAAWSRNSGAAPPVELQARVHSLVTVLPTRLDYQCRVACSVERGSVNALEWKIPADAVVRQVAAADYARHTVTPLSAEESRLTVEFSRPQSREFHIDLAVLLPAAGTTEMLLIPPLVQADPAAPDRVVVVVAGYETGLMTSADFRIHTSSTPAAGATQIPTAAFLQAFARTGEPPAALREPLEAWRLAQPQPLTVTLEPRLTSRRVRLRQTGIVGRGELEWTLRAEVEIREAPAWRHTLVLDPRMIVDVVSVLHDEAERVVRWSRTANRLELYLRDRSGGVHDVIVQGRLPLEAAGETELPLFQFERSEVVDSRLQLEARSSVDVEVVAAEDLSADQAGVEAALENGLVLVGRYRLPHPLPIVPRLRWQTRESPAAAEDMSDAADEPAGNADLPEAPLVPPVTSTSSAALLDTAVRIAEDGRRLGRSTLVLAPPTPARVVFAWPDDVRLRAAVVDGRVVETSVQLSKGGPQVVLKPTAGRPMQLITLHWEHVAAPAPGWFRPIEQPIPLAHEPPLPASLITVVTPRPRRLLRAGTLHEQADIDLALERLERLLEARAATPHAAAAPLDDLIDQLRGDLEPRLSEAEPAASLQVSRQDRLEAIDREIERSRSRGGSRRSDQPAAPAALPAQWTRWHALERPFDHSRPLAAGSIPAAPLDAPVHVTPALLRVWSFDARLPLWTALALGALAAVWFSARIVRLDPGEWLSRHPSAATVLVGIVWWLCLVPGALGFLLAVTALVAGTRRFAHRTSEAADPALNT